MNQIVEYIVHNGMMKDLSVLQESPFAPFDLEKMRPRKERIKDMIKVLFVCWGNICRSPMAEFVMREMVENAGMSAWVEIASAATSSEDIGSPVYPPARKELGRHGISCAGKRARKLTKADYEEYTLLIGMEQLNLRYMKQICGGDPEGKMSLLMDHSDRPGDIADPWYTGDFKGVYKQIREGCLGLLQEIASRKAEKP